MPSVKRTYNRGPAAAARNRSALLGAARRLFTERGYHVPLSAIARAAGVSQGVLYRHFPHRLALAFAVFEDNFTELEELARDPEPTTFHELWDRLLDLTVEETAFVEMVLEARREISDYDGDRRIGALLEGSLRRAHEAGLVSTDLTVDDVLLTQRMVYGLAVTAGDRAAAHRAVERARRLFFSPSFS